MKHRLTPAFVANPPVPSKGRMYYWEGNFGLMVTAKGHKSFVIQYRSGRQSRRMSLKAGLSLQEARREARKILGDVAWGGDPLGERRKADGNSLKVIAEDYMNREGVKLRSAGERTRIFHNLIYPRFGSMPIGSIKRSEIVRLLDDIEENNGVFRAQSVLTVLSKLFNWHADRDDDFLSPIRRGMARIKQQEHARDRILSDDEIMAVWNATGTFPGAYGHLVRFLLLTATRREEASRMTRSEFVNGDDWIIPAARMKNKLEHVIPLSAAAKVIVRSMPRMGEYVFTLNGRRPVNNFDQDKGRLDEASGVTNWRLHDLRRTARSLMSRARVAPDIAERCLAHKIGGISSVYDRYAYYDEKKPAFESLAALVERIVNPADKVVSIRG
jgi:integrase